MKKNAVEIIAGIIGLVVALVVVFIVIGNLTSKGNKTTEKRPTTTKTTRTTRTTKTTKTTERKTTTDKHTTTDSKPIAYDYRIIYNLDGGINNPDNPSGFMEGDDFILKDATKTGYEFLGWFTSETSTARITRINLDTDYELYARFELLHFTITYNNVEGLTNDNPPNYTILDNTITLKDVSKYSSTFLGWFTSPTFEEETRIDTIYTNALKDYVLYASFEAIITDPVVNIQGKNLTYNGNEQELLSANVTGGTIYYSLDNENYSTDVPKAINANTYTIYYKVIGDEYHNDLLDQSITAKINKANYDMSNVDFIDKTVTYNKLVQSNTVTGTLPEGVTVTYEGNEQINAGTYEVIAKFNGDYDNYNTIKDMSAALIINKAAYDMSNVGFAGKTVTFDKLAHSITITGELPEGVTVDYEHNGQTYVGTYEIIANFTGDTTNYEVIHNMTAILNITKATYDMSLVTFNGDTVTYDGEAHSLAISGTLPEGVTVSYENNGKTNYGVYTVTAKFSGDADNYELIDDKTAVLTISKNAYDMSKVSFTGATITYDGNVHSLEITGELPAGVTVSYENNDKTNAGNYTVIAKFSGDSTNYELIPDNEAVLVIKKATYDMSGIEFNGSTITYDGEAHSLAITGELPTGVTVSYENNGKTNYGVYTVTANFSGDAVNHELIDDMTATLRIDKADYDMSHVTFNGDTVTYDGEAHSLAISGTLPEGVTVTYENNGKTDANTYVVTAKFSSNNINYNEIEDMTATLTINKANATYTAPTAITGLIYNGSMQVLVNEGSVSVGYIEYSLDNETWSTTIPSASTPNEYTVYYRFILNSNYNEISSGFVMVIIDKATIDMTGIEFADKTVTYTGSTNSIEITGSLNSNVSVNYVGGGTVVGTYQIIATFTVNTDLYNEIESMKATLTIIPATITNATVNGYSGVYDYNAHNIVVDKTYKTVDDCEATWLYSLDQETWVSEITITNPEDSNTFYFKVSAANHNDYIGHFDAIITDKNITTIEITNLDELSKTYDGSSIVNPIIDSNNDGEITITYSKDGLTFTEEMPINAGHYIIKVEIAETSTYAKGSLQKTFDIYKADYDLTGISFSNKEVTYNGEAHSITITGNLPEGVTVNYIGNGQVNAQTYTITAVFTIEDTDNYNEIDNLTATLTITKATYDMSSIEFNDATYTYTGEAYSLAITGTLPNGVIVSYENNGKTDANTYEVIAKFSGDSTNYELIDDMTATLTINKATYDMSGISFNDLTIPYDGLAHRLTISGTLPSGVSVSYNDTNSYTVVGEYTYVASFSGNTTNYELISDMTATLTIEKATIDMSGVEFNSLTVTYDGNVKSVSVSNLPHEITDVTYTNNNKTDAGTYVVTASFTYDTNNYNIVNDMTATLKINKKVIDTSVIVFNDLTVTYDGSAKSITASNIPNGVTVTYSNNGKTDADNYVVTLNITATDENNYEVSTSSKTATLTIEKASIDMSGVEFNSLTVTYDGNVKSVSVSNLPHEITDVTYTNNNKTDAGTYVVTASFTYDTNNYNTVDDMTTTLKINKKEIDTDVVVFNDLTVNYDGTIKSLVASNLPSGISVSYTNNNKINAGTYSVVANFSYNTTNYTVTLESKTATLKINKINPSYTVPTNLRANTNQTLADITLPNGFTFNDPLTTSVGNEGTNTFLVTYTPSDTTNYNIIDNIEVTITVIYQINYTIICDNNQSTTYNGLEQGPTVTVKLGDEIVTTNYDLSYQYASSSSYTNGLPTNAGTYSIKINCTGSEGSDAAEVIVTYTINKAKLTVTTTNVSLNYNSSIKTWDQVKANIPAINYTGLIGNDTTIISIDGMHNGKYKYGTVNGSYITPTSDTLFGTSYNNVIGSTYLLNISQSNPNYEFKGYNILFKYKTAKISSAFFTIEDALASSGTITLVGDATSAQTYVSTLFSSLPTYITSYETTYTLSNRTLVVSYDESSTSVPSNNNNSGSQTYVYSSLILPEFITLNFTNNSKLVVNANLVYNQSTSSTWANIRGVLVNDGIINLNNGCSVTAYGYIKGNGTMNLYSGATATDLLNKYDYSGGSIASSIYSSCLPFTAWSINNISCETYYYSGAVLQAFSHIQYKLISTSEAKGTAVIIGSNSSSNCLFKPTSTSNSNFIRKYSTPSTTNASADTTALRSITGNNQKKGIMENIELCGDYVDSTLSVSINVTVKTSSSISAPVPYMNIILKSGSTLSLSSSDYLFLPSSSLHIENDSTLNVSSGIDLAFLPWSYFATNTTYNFYANCIDKKDAILINDGTIVANGKIGGVISTNNSSASLSLNGGVNASYTMYFTTSGDTHYETKTTPARLYLYDSSSQVVQLTTLTDTNKGTYYSTRDINDDYGWIYSSNAYHFTITYNTNGANESCDPVTINTGSPTYTITSFDLPLVTKLGYSLVGWYIDSSFNTSAIGYSIDSDISLYAKWSMNSYSIIYNYDYQDGSISTNLENTNPTSFTINDTISLVAASDGDLNFSGWYIDPDYTIILPRITSSTIDAFLGAVEANGNNLDLYCIFSSLAYYQITYFTKDNEIYLDKPMVKVKDGESTQLVAYTGGNYKTNSTNADYTYVLNTFNGWKVYSTDLSYIETVDQLTDYYPTCNIYLKPSFNQTNYVKITKGSLSNATVTISTDDEVPVGTSVTFTISYTEDSEKTFTLTRTSNSAQIVNKTDGTTSYAYIANYNCTYSASSKDSGCLAKGTLITMADGTLKPIEEIQLGDLVKTWSFEEGKFVIRPVIFVEQGLEKLCDYITIKFEDGTNIEIIWRQSLFDVDMMDYILFDINNATSFIGRHILAFDNETLTTKTIVDVIVEQRIAPYYEVDCAYDYQVIANNVLTVEPTVNFHVVFDLDENFKYDSEAMTNDIEQYGLYTYDDLKEYVTLEQFELFNGKIMKIYIEKGYFTFEYLLEIINRYLK